MFSRILAFIILISLIPVFLLIMLFILVNDGFPLIFKQKRVGKNYSFFKLYKFRTMKKHTPNIASHLLLNPDQYVTKSGIILRKLSLDELPNLLNILRGEMVFIGPRPALYNQYDLMELRVNAGVSHLKPGLTGWAQINGRDEISISQKVILEMEYLDKKSLFFDVKIFFLTVISVFFNSHD